MTKTKKPSARELPLVKRRIAVLLEKIEANDCTPGEAATAFEKAEELVAKYKLDPVAFRWSPRVLDDVRLCKVEAATGPRFRPRTRHRQTRRATDRRAPGLDLPAHRRGGERKDRGAAASEKSVRWYASRMWRREDGVPHRRGGLKG